MEKRARERQFALRSGHLFAVDQLGILTGVPGRVPHRGKPGQADPVRASARRHGRPHQRVAAHRPVRRRAAPRGARNHCGARWAAGDLRQGWLKSAAGGDPRGRDRGGQLCVAPTGSPRPVALSGVGAVRRTRRRRVFWPRRPDRARTGHVARDAHHRCGQPVRGAGPVGVGQVVVSAGRTAAAAAPRRPPLRAAGHHAPGTPRAERRQRARPRPLCGPAASGAGAAGPGRHRNRLHHRSRRGAHPAGRMPPGRRTADARRGPRCTGAHPGVAAGSSRGAVHRRRWARGGGVPGTDCRTGSARCRRAAVGADCGRHHPHRPLRGDADRAPAGWVDLGGLR